MFSFCVFVVFFVSFVVCESSAVTGAADVSSDPVVLNSAHVSVSGGGTTGVAVDDLLLKASVGEVYAFQTDINQLLGIIINSLYTNKDIFLRELISNASDAIDKIRYESLLDKSQLATNPDLQIYVRCDAEKRTITVRDDGHGMTKDDLIRELGTIARSGTKYFIQQFTKAKEGDLNLIGQFGVGFYSSFLVAERVIVVSKHNNDPKQHIWSSTADGEFSVMEDPRGNTLGRGTEIILQLKEGMDKYLDATLLEALVTKYSEYVVYPINLWKLYKQQFDDLDDLNQFLEEQEQEEEDDEEEDTDWIDEEEFDDMDDMDDDDWEDPDVEDPDDDLEEEDFEEIIPSSSQYVTSYEWKVVNQNQPLWTRNPKSIYKEEYHNFYKANAKLNGIWNPLAWTHFQVEGNIEFSSILFIPKKHPDTWMPVNGTDGITLYVKRVMITENVVGFVPSYLHFITGIVDSNDLPLHISRELLQKSKLIHVIKRKLVSKIFALIKKLAREERVKRTEEKRDRMHAMLDRPLEEPDEERYPYTKFWEDWGVNLRSGIIQDPESRKDLIPLLRYYSTKSEDELTSFEDYVARMPENQKYIYYLAGENFEQVRTSLFLEELKKRDFEVLYFTDAIDEYLVQHVKQYAGLKLMSASDPRIKYGDEDDPDVKKDWRKTKRTFKPLIRYIEKLLGTQIQEARCSRRLRESMAAIVAPKYGLTANRLRLARAQALAHGVDELNKMMMKQRILEINPYHTVVGKLLKRITDNERDQMSRIMVRLMFDTALVRSGYDLGTNEGMADRVSQVMLWALGDTEMMDMDEVVVDDVLDEDEDFDDYSMEDFVDVLDELDLDEPGMDDETIDEDVVLIPEDYLEDDEL